MVGDGGSTQDLVWLNSLPWDGLPSAGRALCVELLRDYRILFVDPPVNALRDPRPRLRTMGDRLSVLTPTRAPVYLAGGVPWAQRHLVRASSWCSAQQVLRTMRCLAMHQPYVVQSMATNIAPLVAQESRLVLHHVSDDFDGYAAAVPYRRQMDEWTRHADLVVASSHSLAAKVAAKGFSGPIEVLPNGVDFQLFASTGGPPEDLPTGRPLAGYAGNLDQRLSMTAVLGLADEVEVALIGPDNMAPGMRDAFRRHPRIHLLGPKPQALLPDYLQACDVLVMPYAKTALTEVLEAPMKLYEYLATGKPVVATDLPSLRTNGDGLVFASEDGLGVAAADVLDASRNAASCSADRQALARQNSWSARADLLRSWIRAHDQGAPSLPPAAQSAP